MLNDDDDELFLWYGWPTKGVQPYFQLGLLSEILTIANLRHAASRIWTCAEPELRLSWMKLCRSDNHYTTARQQAKFAKFNFHEIFENFFAKIYSFISVILLIPFYSFDLQNQIVQSLIFQTLPIVWKTISGNA